MNASRQNVNREQRDRLYDVAAFGPASVVPGDEQLAAMGLIRIRGEYAEARCINGRVCYFSAENGSFLPVVA